MFKVKVNENKFAEVYPHQSNINHIQVHYRDANDNKISSGFFNYWKGKDYEAFEIVHWTAHRDSKSTCYRISDGKKVKTHLEDFKLMKEIYNSIDWEALIYIKERAANMQFDERFYEDVEKYKDHINWDVFSRHEFPLDFVKKFKKKIFFTNYLYENKGRFGEEFYYEFKDYAHIEYFATYTRLSEEFIRSKLDKLKWHVICSYQKLSEKFIREFIDKVDWRSISGTQELSNEFIKEFQDRIDWDSLSEYRELSEDTIRMFQYKVKWYHISKNQKLSEGFMREFKDKINWDVACANQELSISFIIELKMYMKWEAVVERYTLPFEIIMEYIDYIDLKLLKLSKRKDLKPKQKEAIKIAKTILGA